MKTKVLLSLLIVICFVNHMFAIKLPKMNVTAMNDKKALIELQYANDNDLELTVKNRGGAVLYRKNVKDKESEFKKVFDFSQLRKGDYQISMRYNNCLVYRDLAVFGRELKIGEEIITHKPVFQHSDGIVTVTCLNPSGETVLLSIYRNGKYHSQHTIGNDIAMHKTFDISSLRNGNYEFVVKDYNGQHKYNLSQGY